MVRRAITIFILAVLCYILLVQFQIVIARKNKKMGTPQATEQKTAHKVQAFSFTKYTTEGAKEIEIEGKSDRKSVV